MKYLLLMLVLMSGSLWGQDSTATVKEKVQLIPIEEEKQLDCQDVDEIFLDTMFYEGGPSVWNTTLDGHLVSAMITDDGDTIYMDKLRDISITSLRKFKSDEDYQKYLKFRRYAAFVYPYAKEAIKIFRETEHATLTMKKRKRKKHIKKLQEDLNEQFEEPLKKMTKLQGKIMIKMIEKELDRDMYSLISELRGKFQAFYWHNASKLYSYDLKEGYQEGKYEILDAVLQDFDISYKMEQEEKLNKK
jgi:hypothetical protein